MIIFLAPGGRLGNLLFQVAYLESIRRPRERVFAMNLFGVHRLLRLRRYHNTDFRPFTRFLDKALLPWLGKFLEKTGLVTTHREWDSQITIRNGLFPLTFVEGYFQRPPEQSPGFSLPRTVVEAARRFLLDHAAGPAVFVHVRRGDYHTYRVNGFVDPLLPSEYYREALRVLRDAHPGVHTFFLGDSPKWCEEVFGDIEPKTVSALSPHEDLALMGLCLGGVVSNSTFAWWGAFFCGRELPVVAPRYWLGWRHGFWLPRRIETAWMTYVDVPEVIP